MKNNKLVIAVDFDGTYTADPTLWQNFILAAKARGHLVYIVTSRSFFAANQDIFDSVEGVATHIYFTSGELKQEYMENIGISVDIWIDDKPEKIVGTGTTINIYK